MPLKMMGDWSCLLFICNCRLIKVAIFTQLITFRVMLLIIIVDHMPQLFLNIIVPITLSQITRNPVLEYLLVNLYTVFQIMKLKVEVRMLLLLQPHFNRMFDVFVHMSVPFRTSLLRPFFKLLHCYLYICFGSLLRLGSQLVKKPSDLLSGFV